MGALLPTLKQQGFLDQVPMTIVNVGSRKLDMPDDYGSQSWGLFAPNLTIYGFDADQDACDVANGDIAIRQVPWREVHLPMALGKANEERTLYVTKNVMCSSLYPPNEPFLNRFIHLPEHSNLDFSLPIETVTLDWFCETQGVESIDFLQIDVQGADLDVLQGGLGILNSVFAVQIEVEFNSLYQGQPLFRDIDKFLSEQGFSLFDSTMFGRTRVRSPIYGRNQILWGDAFYFRDLLSESSNEHLKTADNLAQNLFKLACVADALNFPDYSIELLEYLTLNYGHDPKYNFADAIVMALKQIPDLQDQNLADLPLIQSIREFLTPSILD